MQRLEFNMVRMLVGTLLAALFFAPVALKAAPIAAEAAVKRLNQEVQVQMKVRSSKLRTDRDEVDLNSNTNFRDPFNLAVVVDGRVTAWYSYQGIHDLPKFFFGKNILVSGVVEQFGDQTRILVVDPGQIQIVK